MMDVFIKLFPLLVVALLAGAALVLLAGIQKKILAKGRANQYERHVALMSPAELRFFRVLEEALNGQFYLFTKVRLADVLQPKKGLVGAARMSAFGMIQSKHVDFVACAPADMSIQFVVELDDKSHERPNRMERDIKVDDALAQAGIPIFRFPVRSAYLVEDIQEVIFRPPPMPQ
jgi:hypothetical protein